MLLVNRYRIESTLAEGGLGSVSLAHDEQLNRKVAIKHLHADAAVDAQSAFDTILAESQALSALKSPNIVSVYDIQQGETGPFVVMEYVEGETLAEVIARAPLTETDFLSVADQALEAIIAAHSVGIIHRDLKPENLMITWWPSGRFQLKVLDFGLALMAGNAAQDLSDGSLMGSIYFMAPEQFRNAHLDQRTDLYALGCVFYHALTGVVPFEGDSAAQVMASHLQGRVEDLFERRPDIDPRIADWVMGLIAQRPDDRPIDARTALEQLQEIQRVPLADIIAAEQNAAGEQISEEIVAATDNQTKVLITIASVLVGLLLLGIIYLAL